MIEMKLYKIPIKKIVAPTIFMSRGTARKMSYRYYPSWSTHTLVLFHGLVSNSMYLGPLAHRIAERKIAQVIVPDWRGHGEDNGSLHWDKPLEVIQDFEEILVHFKSRTAVERISALGHSFGARWLCQILAEAPPSLKFDRSYLLAPYLDSKQLKPGWIDEIGEEYRVSWPENIRTGVERTQYPISFLDHFNNLNMSSIFSQSKFQILEAGEDEILKSPFLEGRGNQDLAADSLVLPQASHMGLVMESQHIEFICDLIERTI
jgi:pimeloyl-ACP methyl ester carboxylesterase